MVNVVTEGNGPQQFFNHPLIKKDSIEFRLYQNNIFEAVKNKNALVILPTALGKTIIAVLVCAEFQHTTSFLSVLKMPEDSITVVTGKNSSQTRRAIWNQKESRLVFPTPEVVKNDLVERRLSLGEFSLLVFDEAHRAVKDYAYTLIAKYYVRQSSHPVILAMTASPGSDRGRIEEVCNNLSIEKIEYWNEDDVYVERYINTIDTTWKWFTIPQEYKYISTSLRAMLEDKLQFLIKRGLLRKKYTQWIFKSDLLKLGEEILYKIDSSQEELRRPLYSALMQQSSALTLMYCAEFIDHPLNLASGPTN